MSKSYIATEYLLYSLCPSVLLSATTKSNQTFVRGGGYVLQSVGTMQEYNSGVLVKLA